MPVLLCIRETRSYIYIYIYIYLHVQYKPMVRCIYIYVYYVCMYVHNMYLSRCFLYWGRVFVSKFMFVSLQRHVYDVYVHVYVYVYVYFYVCIYYAWYITHTIYKYIYWIVLINISPVIYFIHICIHNTYIHTCIYIHT